MKKIYKYRKKIFLHKEIVNRLRDNDFQGLTTDQKNVIHDGFCYTLAMDWLFQPLHAQKYYFDCTLKEDDPIPWTLDRILYFSTLAIWFEKYQQICNGYKPVTYTNEKNVQYSSIAHNKLFDIDNYFAELHYKRVFDKWNIFSDITSLNNVFNNTTKQFCNCCLFNIVNKDNKNNKFARHTIAARLHVDKQSGVNKFFFFDPAHGVFEVNDIITQQNIYLPALFLASLLDSYKFWKLDFTAAYFSYKNFVF